MRGLKPLIIVLLLSQVFCCTNRTDYELISAYQDHSIPGVDIEVTDSTNVLVVMPHADDETIAGGLIAFLKDKGASIHLLTLCEHNGNRIMELHCAASKLGIDKVEIAGFVNNSWEDIMQDSIAFWYDHKDSIRNVIAKKIYLFEPDILITYDSQIGGYGHPEHRISAELTELIFRENKNNPGFSPKKIFQITLTKQLETFLVSGSPGYELAKSLTGSSGLPKPDVSIDITKYWKAKNEAGRCHQSQIDILKRFYIVYDEKNQHEHINAFSKEYYRVVE